MKTSFTKRMLALLLVLCMVIPMLPTFTLPAKAAASTVEPVIVIAGSDFQANTHELSAANVEALLNSIKNNGGYSEVDGFLFEGDYSNATSTAQTTAGLAALKTAVENVYPGLSISDTAIYVQGNHDPDALTTDGTLAATGAHDTDAYGVYVLNQKDHRWHATGTEAESVAAAGALSNYLKQKLVDGYNKPIFVVSHIPLHYTMRTSLYGDGRYANYYFDVLNSAAGAGLNIIFLFGHHHSNSWLDSQGGSAVLFQKGDQINIAQANQSVYVTETLNFTYMNAGYVGYYSTTNTTAGVEKDLTMSVFEITGNEVKISRYSADGLHDVKSAGVANTAHSESWSVDSRVVASPATVKLSDIVSSASGITVSSEGVTRVEAEEVTSQIPLGYSAYRTYSIDPKGYSRGKPAVVSIPVGADFDASRPALVIDHVNGYVHTCNIVSGRVNFVTNHFSNYTVAQEDVSPFTASKTIKLLQRVTSINDLQEGVPYVISDYKTSWYHYMLTNTVSTVSGRNGLLLDGVPSADTEHLWYIRDGKIVYGSADSDQYLLIAANTDGVYLGAYNETYAAYAQTYSGDDFAIRSSSAYLNRYGGAMNSIVATYYSAAGGSYWHFDAVAEQEVAVSVTPSMTTMTIDQTAVMVPGVTVAGAVSNDYTITWSSTDATVATVNADGFVQALKPGKTTIIATLTEVNGQTLKESVQVNVPLNIYQTSLGSHVATAVGVIHPYLEQTAELVAGTPSGPYVITSNLNSVYKNLSNNIVNNGYTKKDGLELVAIDDYSHLWYYDGAHFRYGAPDGPYLVYANGIVTLGSNADDAFDTLQKDATYDVYTISNSHVSGSNCLNHSGGQNYNTVGLYSNGIWIINKVATSNVRLTVTPGSLNLLQGKTRQIAGSVTVDGAVTSNKVITWSSDNTLVATVSASGTITAVAPGTANITATLTSVDGKTNISPVSVTVPVTVTAEAVTSNAVVATGYADKGMNKITNVTPGVPSGPYVIQNPLINPLTYLSGNGPVDSGKCVGLELVYDHNYEHLWYYDGTHLRYNDPNGPYLAYENEQVVLSKSSDYAFNDVHRLVNADGTLSSGYIIQNDHITGYNCLNQLGGKGYMAAGVYAEISSSRWYLYEASVNEPVTLSVTPGIETIVVGETVTLDPTVMLGGAVTNNYTISWASSDTSIATVSNGVVSGLKEGNVTITATLTQANGIGARISAEIVIYVVKLEQRSASWTTATTALNARPVQVTSLPAGTDGPYLIVNRGTGYILAGMQDVASPATTGLWLRPSTGGDYNDLWFYDGAHLIYGDPNATDRYLVWENNMVTLGSDTDAAFDVFTPVTKYRVGAFSISADHNVGQYLNQYGSDTYEALGVYTQDGNSNAGSAWDFYSLVTNDQVVLSGYAEDGSALLPVTKTKKIAHQLLLDATTHKNYTVSYSVSDPTVASIGRDGTVYPWKSGTVTVYVKLETVDGIAVGVDLVAPVTLTVCGVQSGSVNVKEGALPVNASDRLKVSAVSEGGTVPVLTVNYENGIQEQIPLTNAYMTDANGNEIDTSAAEVYENVTIAYEGVVFCSDFTLHIRASDLPDYPEYPAEGSVFVDKYAVDSQNFQSSGVAQVEVSASGVPVKKGADVIIMLDSSSSMGNPVVGASSIRLNVLCDSLNDLINGFQTKAADGTTMDVRVAVADFNGFYHDPFSPYYIDEADTMSNSTIRSGTNSEAKIYTGDKTLGAGAFIQATEFGLNPFTTNQNYQGDTTRKYTLTMGSGTNYDYAFDAVYQMGEAIHDANAEAGEDRDLFVIFMSDGAPFQYNYFGSQSGTTYWSEFLMGTMEDSMFAANSHRAYYREDGMHWMAEAIKGSRKQTYPVIRKNDHRDTDGDNFVDVQGLGATMYSIGFCLLVDGQITVESMEHVIEQIATNEEYSFFANNAQELDTAFEKISNDIMYAASDAYMIDYMGADYDLQLGNRAYTHNGVPTTFTDNCIELRTYQIYTQADYESGLCTEKQIGVRKTDEDGNYIYTVDEVVTFNAAGTRAYSNKISSTDANGTVTYPNIFNNGVISGYYFQYNTTASAQNITLDNGDTFNLAGEAFYWEVGTISTAEKALNYYVYLTGTQESTRNAGIYPTNKSATLYYENYLGNRCFLTAPVPKMPWSQAQVSYGFYLVDRAGNPIVNEGKGMTGSFEQSIKSVVLCDIVGKEFATGNTVSIYANKVLPRAVSEKYRLFDSAARYDVSLNNDGFGTTAVYTDGIVPQSTYVTGLATAPVLRGDAQGTIKDHTGFVTANTTVWFAVVANDDEVIVDKTVAAVDGETDKFTLTLDAYSTGSTVQKASNKPSDIVLVLDQSSTMYTPVGIDADRISINDLANARSQLSDYAITDFETRVNAGDQELLDNAKHLGYYIAIHNRYNYIYIVQYAQNAAGQWGWYYVPVDQTVRTVAVDTENATNDTDAALAMGYNTTTQSYQPYGYGTYAQTHANNALLGTGLVTYYQSQYGALYDTLQQFVTDLKEEAVASGLDHRVAVVGFSSPFYDGWTGYDGTGIYVDGDYYLYDSDYKYVKNGTIYDPDKVFGSGADDYSSGSIMTSSKFHDFNVTEQTYADALVSVKDDYDSVMNSVKAYTANYQQTCPSIGISIAQSIFAARESTEDLFTDAAISDKLNPGNPTYSNNGNTYAEDQDDEHIRSNYTEDNAEDREEIIILFTDGVPTVRCSSDRDLGQSSHKAVAAEFWTISAGIDDVIDHAYEAKQAGIQIYGIGTSKAVMTQYGTQFFEHVSSDDLTAQSALTINESWLKDSAGVYYLNGATASASIIHSSYEDKGYTMYTSDEDMDLAKAFDTIYASIVETVALDETAVLKEVLSDYFDLDNLTEEELLSNISVYTADYLGMDEKGNNLFSDELVPFSDAKVEIVKSADGRNATVCVSNFDYSTEYISVFGGQPRGRKLVVKVAIEAREGFWGGNNVPTNDAATAIYTPEGEAYVNFPMPEVNVPVDPVLVTKDKTVYYGSHLNADELVDSITVDGVEVTIDKTGALKPQQSWMDDFATLTWTEGSNIPGISVPSGRDSDVYPFSVELTPIYDGTENRSDNPSNMAGASVETRTDSADANVYVLEPVITWKDVVIDLGDNVGESFYEKNDLVSIEWVDQDTRSQPVLAPEDEAPELELQYSVSGQPLQYTPVDVTVISSNGNEEITHVVTYLWQDCSQPNHLTNRDQIFEHKGNETSAEFYIHVVGGDVLVSDKTIEAGQNGTFELTMEGYVTGSVSSITVTKPADIVLVLDHSASMHTPVGAPDILHSPKTDANGTVIDPGAVYTGAGQMTKADLDTTKGAHRGYYVAQSTSSKWWFLMEYDAANAKWIGYSIPSTESIVDPVVGNYTEHTKTQRWSYSEIPAQLVFYKTQYGVLYDSVVKFVNDLKASGVEHSVAIVGFAGSQTDGTRIYVGGDETATKTYKALYHVNTTDARRTELFQKAMKNVQDEQQFAQLLSNIETIETNASFTCPTAGLLLANELYKANELDRVERDRIMILFTDGIPNRAFGEDATTSTTQDQRYDEIVKTAVICKQEYGTKIYSVSTTTMGAGANRTFLSYASSDYPNAVDYYNPGTRAEGTNFTSEVNGIDDMDIVFQEVTTAVSGTKVQMDGTCVLRDTLSDYFDLAGTTADVKVYQQAYLGNDRWSTPVEMTGSHIQVNYSSSANDGRTDVIEVSGYNYSEEYLSEEATTRTVTTPAGERTTKADYHGSRILVKVTVKPRDGFWGGNNVPTNENSAGIYGADNDLLDSFPEPEANVPVKPQITAKDQVVYYGETGVDAMDDLVGTITVGGEEVTYDPENGTFTPKADWMDDFADLHWDEDLFNPADPDATVSGTKADDYTFGLVVTPKPEQSGENNSKYEGDDYIAGTPVGPEGESGTATGSVDVLVPVISFKDSTIELGDKTDDGYYETANRQPAIEWVNQEDPYGDQGLSADASDKFDTVPELSFTYTPDSTDDDYFTNDTPVNVEVHLGSEPTGDNKITHEAYFDWSHCDSELHDEHETVVDSKDGDTVHRHKGDVSSAEFYIHLTFMLEKDTVVIDFGIPVDIDATFNDVLPGDAEIAGIKLGGSISAPFATTADPDFAGSAVSAHGTLTLQANGKLRYVPSGMKMNVSEVFQYEIRYNTTETNAQGQTVAVTRYYRSTVTVIPATIIYYEDDFLTFYTEVLQADGSYKTEEGGWTNVGSASDVLQEQDRPGVGEAEIDANQIYGYDKNYANMDTYSYGSARKIKVSNGTAGIARFSFRGTGFDIVSLSSDDTGVVLVQITDADTGASVANYMVDTYYGYSTNYYKITYTFTNGKWTMVQTAITRGEMGTSQKAPETPAEGATYVQYVTRLEPNTSASDTLYQVPVIKVDLNEKVKTKDDVNTTDVDETTYYGYGHYNVEIYVGYSDLFAHGQCDCAADENCTGCFDFYLDAIRIYDPANDGAEDEVVEDAYIADHEYKPTYEELRNHLITVGQFDALGKDDDISGVIFIDSNKVLEDGSASGVPGGMDATTGLSAIADYTNYGPNNELYLAAGQAVAFTLAGNASIDQVHLALKSVGGSAEISVYGVDAQGTVEVLKDHKVNTATDLYYNISDLIGKTVVIRNSGDSGILSITNLKTTYLSTAANGVSVFSMNRSNAELVLSSLNESAPAPVVPEVSADDLAPTYATVTFEDEIKLNIYFEVNEDVLNGAELGMITFDAEIENGTIENAQTVYTDVTFDAAQGLYRVSTKGIAAKNLSDLIWFRVYARLADGSVVYSKLLSYSAKQYADMVIGSDAYSAEMRELAVSMLNYGAQAQLYFGYRTDALMNAHLTAEQQNVAYSSELFKGVVQPDANKLGAFAATADGFTRKYPTVSFEGAFALSYYFSTSAAADAAPVLYYWTASDYENAQILTADNATGVLTMEGSDLFSATVPGIAPKDMNSTVYVAAVYQSQGNSYCSGVLPYSLGAYFQVQAQAEGTAMQSLAKAAAVYGSCAEAYFAET